MSPTESVLKKREDAFTMTVLWLPISQLMLPSPDLRARGLRPEGLWFSPPGGRHLKPPTWYIFRLRKGLLGLPVCTMKKG